MTGSCWTDELLEVRLYGGQVTSWKNEQGDELLFVSSKAIFKSPGAIRGGIPICFPQFGTHGNLEKHGFARNRLWLVDDNPPPLPVNSGIKTYADLILKPSEEDLKIWPHRFEFRLRVALGPKGDLFLTSRIRNTNTDGKPFSFTFAYHTYFSVSDISFPVPMHHNSKLYYVLTETAKFLSEVRIEGLETMDYFDNLKGKERFTEQGDALVFESEIDKVYLDTPPKIAIIDHEKKRTFVLRKDGLPDAVVWNPWERRSKTILDFGDEEYKHMLCVEPAAVEKPITLKPGEEWKGRLELSAVPSSYYSGQLDPDKVMFNPRFVTVWVAIWKVGNAFLNNAAVTFRNVLMPKVFGVRGATAYSVNHQNAFAVSAVSSFRWERDNSIILMSQANLQPPKWVTKSGKISIHTAW
uniref:glucose-6-phosphate 1-epimerase n=1 Tax=Aegilops tauschii TaxID=37682 RepID=R7WDN6_AEGTA